MTDWKRCDGCGAKYRGNACQYCMTVEDDYEESAGMTENLYFVADSIPDSYLYDDCWPKANPAVCDE